MATLVETADRVFQALKCACGQKDRVIRQSRRTFVHVLLIRIATKSGEQVRSLPTQFGRSTSQRLHGPSTVNSTCLGQKQFYGYHKNFTGPVCFELTTSMACMSLPKTACHEYRASTTIIPAEKEDGAHIHNSSSFDAPNVDELDGLRRADSH